MIRFLKTRDVKDPKRNEGEDAGIDIYVPEWSKSFAEEVKKSNPYMEMTDKDFEGCLVRNGKLRSTITKSGIYVLPGDDVKIPSGLHSRFDSDIMLKVDNKSGVCLKQKFIVGANIIDSSYQGEIQIHVINYAQNIVTKLEFGQKMVQLIPIRINTEKHEAINAYNKNVDEELKKFYEDHNSSRGTGAFGSTSLE